MKAKEWLFKNYPQVKDEWQKTGHDDNYMVRMMEEYAQAKLKNNGVLADVSMSLDKRCKSCTKRLSTDERKKRKCEYCGNSC